MNVPILVLCFLKISLSFIASIGASMGVCLCVPVLAVLDALTQCGSLSERRVPTATSTSGQDAILDYYGEGKKS